MRINGRMRRLRHATTEFFLPDRRQVAEQEFRCLAGRPHENAQPLPLQAPGMAQGRLDRRHPRVRTSVVVGLDPRPVLGLQPRRLPGPAQQQLPPRRPTGVDPDSLQPSHQQLDRASASIAMKRARWRRNSLSALRSWQHLGRRQPHDDAFSLPHEQARRLPAVLLRQDGHPHGSVQSHLSGLVVRPCSSLRGIARAFRA